MTTKELQDQHPDAFKAIGGISYNLNRLETYIITTLSFFFVDAANPQSEKSFIFNQALFDEAVFPTLENKRRMLIKVIQHLWRVAEECGVAFDRDGFMAFCESINKIQQIRNEIAHHDLGFTADGKATYLVRKSNEELLHQTKTGQGKGSHKTVEIDLNKGLAKSQEACDVAEKFLSDFVKQSQEVLAAQWKMQRERAAQSK